MDREREIAAITRWVAEAFSDRERFALRFDRVRGFDQPVIVGLYGSRDLYGAALGVGADRLLDHWGAALAAPRPPQRAARPGAVHENVATGADVDLRLLAVPVWTPGRDAGPYLPAAAVITVDPETGIQNLATYRIQIQGRDRAGLFFGTQRQHGAIHLERHRRAGRPMQVAVVIGPPPAVQFAAAAKTAYGVDELEIAGGLAGEPVEVVKGKTVDLLVPARSEIVIEGIVRPDRRGHEGPFGEALGYMNLAADAPVIEVTAVTQRRGSIMHGCMQQLPPSEGHLIWEMGVLGCIGYYLRDKMGLRVIRDLAVVPGSAGVSMLAVALEYGAHAEAERVAEALTAVSFGQKLVLLVDDDIDVHDLHTLQWALSSRADLKRDIRIVEGMSSYQLDPAALSARRPGEPEPTPPYPCATMIIDATLKTAGPAVALPEPAAMERARMRWAELGLPALPPCPRLSRLLDRHRGPGDRMTLPKRPS